MNRTSNQKRFSKYEDVKAPHVQEENPDDSQEDELYEDQYIEKFNLEIDVEQIPQRAV